MSSITLKTVKMKDGTRKLQLVSPYNPDAPKRARALGGAWSSVDKAWYFPTDISGQVRQLCLDIYGIDPLADTATDLVDIRYILDYDDDTTSSRSDSFFLFGREILHRPGRDSAVRPGEGVSIIAGGFKSAGGSRNNPSLSGAEDGTTLLIRGVARSAALAFQAGKVEGSVTIAEREEPNSLLLEQATAAAATLASLLKKLGKDDRNIVVAQLVGALEEAQGA